MLWFLVLFFGGLGLIIYREKVQRVSGDIGFAEKYLGPGGTFQFYLLLGIAMVFISIIYVTGGLDAFIENTIGRFFIAPNR